MVEDTVGATAVEDTAAAMAAMAAATVMVEAAGTAVGVAEAAAGAGVVVESGSGEEGGTATQNRRLGLWDREEEFTCHF